MNLAQILDLEPDKRDSQWEAQFFSLFVEAELQIVQPDVTLGPDGFSYLLVRWDGSRLSSNSPHAGSVHADDNASGRAPLANPADLDKADASNTTADSLASSLGGHMAHLSKAAPIAATGATDSYQSAHQVLDWLHKRGVGLAVNTHKQWPDYIFNYGMVWFFQEHGSFYQVQEPAKDLQKDRELVQPQESVQKPQPQESVQKPQPQELVQPPLVNQPRPHERRQPKSPSVQQKPLLAKQPDPTKGAQQKPLSDQQQQRPINTSPEPTSAEPTSAPTHATPSHHSVHLQQGEKFWISDASKEYLPTYVRQIIREFLKQQGVLSPRIALIRKLEAHNYDLCFSLESLGNPPQKEQAGIAQALAWFLPLHYSVTLIQEKSLAPFFNL